MRFWFCFLKIDSFLNFSISCLDCSKQLEVSLDGNILFDQLSLSTEHVCSCTAGCTVKLEA